MLSRFNTGVRRFGRIMCSRLDCPVCFEEYDNCDGRQARVGICGHTICSNCLTALKVVMRSKVSITSPFLYNALWKAVVGNQPATRNYSCPQCRRLNAFFGAPPNFQLIDALTATRLIRSDLERESEKTLNLTDLVNALETQLELQSVHNKLFEKQMSEASYFACSECGFHVRQDRSRICIDCGVSNGCVYTFTDRPNGKCFLYPKADEFILCGSCALDGDHKDHNTQFYLPLKLASRSDLFLNGNKDADPLNENRLVDEMNEIVSRSKAFQQNINSLIGLSMMSSSIAEYEQMEEQLSELMKSHSDATIDFKKQLTAYSTLIRNLQTRFDEVMASKIHGAVRNLSDDELSITDEFAPVTVLTHLTRRMRSIRISQIPVHYDVVLKRLLSECTEDDRDLIENGYSPPLRESSTASSYSQSTPVITPSSTEMISPRNGREMWEMRIDTRDDDFIILRVSPEDVGRSVKQRILERLGTPVDEQVLVFNGKTLLNDHTLRSIGLYNGAKILLYSL